MKRRRKKFTHEEILNMSLRLDPENRLCPLYDCTSITYQQVADPHVMGMRVLDNCCEDHIM